MLEATLQMIEDTSKYIYGGHKFFQEGLRMASKNSETLGLFENSQSQHPIY